MDVLGFVLLATGAAAVDSIAIGLFADGVFRVLAGYRLLGGGPPPEYLGPLFPHEDGRALGRVGIISGAGKAFAGAVLIGGMVWLTSRDWHLWGRTLSILGRSSSPFLEVLGLFVTCTAAASFYVSFRLARELYRPIRQDAGPRTRDQDPRKAQSRAAGTILIVSGTVLCVVCVVVAAFLTVKVFFIGAPPWVEIVPVVVMLSGPAYAGGQNLLRRGRRHFVRVLSTPDQRDGFVLYLRWFKEDSVLDRAYPRVGSPFLFHFLISGASEEEQLVKVLKPYGRVVAVGDPTEALPRVGADRFYLPFEGWHEPVRELMARARLVVLSLGMGEGTLWELVEAMSTLPPKRLILLVPMDQEDYEAFRREAHRRLPEGRRLPEYRPDARSPRRSMSQGHRAAIRRTGPGSLRTTIGEGLSVGTATSFNRQAESVFQAVVRFPTWAAPVFTRLDTAVAEAGRPTLFRDPRYVALENCLRPVLDRSLLGEGRRR